MPLKALKRWWQPMVDPLGYVVDAFDATLTEAPAAPGDYLKRLALQLQRRTRRREGGDALSMQRGHGLDIHHLREYVPGDDFRKMDWNVFARTLSPHVKEFQEERRLVVWLLLDLTPSMYTGGRQSKAAAAVELACLLGLMANMGKHRVGASVVTGRGERVIPARGGYTHLESMSEQLLSLLQQAQPRLSDPTLPVDQVLGHYQRVARAIPRHAQVFMLSDFDIQAFASPAQAMLADLSSHRELTLVHLRDPLDVALPPVPGLRLLYDPETRQQVWLDSADATARNNYRQAVETADRALVGQLNRWGHTVSVSTDQTALDALNRLRQPLSRARA